MSNPAIVWFRRDVRLSDQAAIVAAVAEGPVIPVYILDDETPRHRQMGGASRWWLHHSLASLDKRLRDKGSQLILRRGNSADILARIAAETGAHSVHALRHYEPWWRNAERALRAQLPQGCQLCRHDGNYLLPIGAVTTGSGDPYKIYTPFWKSLHERMPPTDPLPEPQKIDAPESWPASEKLDDWGLLPAKPDWAEHFGTAWNPGEKGAHDNCDDFIDNATSYDVDRNLPSIEGTSRLSPHLHFGEISPATVWHKVSGRGRIVTVYQKELAWRDYAQNIIAQFPDYGSKSYRENFNDFPWRDFRS